MPVSVNQYALPQSELSITSLVNCEVSREVTHIWVALCKEEV